MQTVGQQRAPGVAPHRARRQQCQEQRLRAIAAAIRRESDALVAANQDDLAAARTAGLEPALLDRLTLSEKGVAAMAEGVEQVAAWPTRSARSATSSSGRVASRSAACAYRWG
jgi:glutamate-5-semialdehyde dehydrogenase